MYFRHAYGGTSEDECGDFKSDCNHGSIQGNTGVIDPLQYGSGDWINFCIHFIQNILYFIKMVLNNVKLEKKILFNMTVICCSR